MANIETNEPQPRPASTQDGRGPLVGSTFAGYELVGVLGDGPSGTTYRAEDPSGAPLVMKVLEAGSRTADRGRQLAAELRRLSDLGSLHHQHVYEADLAEDGRWYMVTDELVGLDLERAIRDGLAPSRALDVIRQICLGLEAAHALGVVHGGLTPHNVYLTPSTDGMIVRLLDFGHARIVSDASGLVVGNPHYLAPEQLSRAPDARSDIYALAVIVYRLFSGRLPSTDPSPGEAILRKQVAPPAPAGVDPALSRIIMRALQPAPSERFVSVRQLRGALESWARSSATRLKDAVALRLATEAAQAAHTTVLMTPEATNEMSKIDVVELADKARMELAPPAPADSGKPISPETDTNPNSSESVEASLEDFISQANASFPTSDGWDLHTGDVELLDEEGVEPALPPPPTAARRSVEIEPDLAPRRGMDHSAPAPAPAVVSVAAPWTANPLVWGGGMLVAILIGGGLMILALRTMMPVQQQLPPTIVQPLPSAPVVTPLPGQPVVTPLPGAAAAAPTVAPTEVTPTPAEDPAAAAAAPAEEVAPPEAAAAPAAVAAPVRTPKRSAKPKRVQRAPKPKAAADEPAPKKGADWVDPFSQ